MAQRGMILVRRVFSLDMRSGVQGVNGMHTSSRMQMGFGSHSSDNDPDVIDKEKEKSLSGALR